VKRKLRFLSSLLLSRLSGGDTPYSYSGKEQERACPRRERGLCTAAAAAGAAGGPVLPGVATPVEDLDGAVEVGRGVARGAAAVAGVPVAAVDLPETDIDGAVAVLVAGVGVAARLVLDNALAAALGPAAVLGAPGADIDVGAATAGAAATVGLVEGLDCNGRGKDRKNSVDELHLQR